MQTLGKKNTAINLVVVALELQTKVAEDYAKLYNHGGPYWLKVPTSAFKFHYVKQTLTPR